MQISWRKYLPERIQEKLSRKENLVAIALNSFWLVSDRVLRMAVTLLVGAWTARYLDKEKFGIFNNALAYSTIFASLASLGIDSIVIRDIVKNPNEKNRYLGTAFYLKLIAGIASYLLALTGLFLFYGNYNPGFKILIIIISAGAIFQAFDVIDYYYQSIVKSKYTVIARNSVFLLINIFKIYLIVAQYDLLYFALAWLFEIALIALSLVIVYSRKNGNIRNWRWDSQLARALLSESWALYVGFVFSFIYMRIDQLMISKMVTDPAQAGLFAASTKIYEIPFFIIIVLTTSFYPSLIRLHQSNQALFYKRYSQITAFYSLLGLLGFAFTLLFGDYVIKVLFSDRYAGTFPILSLQIAGVVFMFNAGLRSSYLTIISRQRIIMTTSIIAALLNIGLNFYLIPRYQAKGAALATAITQCVSLLMLNLIFRDTRRIFKIQIKSLFLLNFKELLFFLPKFKKIH